MCKWPNISYKLLTSVCCLLDRCFSYTMGKVTLAALNFCFKKRVWQAVYFCCTALCGISLYSIETSIKGAQIFAIFRFSSYCVQWLRSVLACKYKQSSCCTNSEERRNLRKKTCGLEHCFKEFIECWIPSLKTPLCRFNLCCKQFIIVLEVAVEHCKHLFSTTKDCCSFHVDKKLTNIQLLAYFLLVKG